MYARSHAYADTQRDLRLGRVHSMPHAATLPGGKVHGRVHGQQRPEPRVAHLATGSVYARGTAAAHELDLRRMTISPSECAEKIASTMSSFSGRAVVRGGRIMPRSRSLSLSRSRPFSRPFSPRSRSPRSRWLGPEDVW